MRCSLVRQHTTPSFFDATEVQHLCSDCFAWKSRLVVLQKNCAGIPCMTGLPGPSDDEVREQCCQTDFPWAEQFDWSRLAVDYHAAYAKVLGQ